MNSEGVSSRYCTDRDSASPQIQTSQLRHRSTPSLFHLFHDPSIPHKSTQIHSSALLLPRAYPSLPSKPQESFSPSLSVLSAQHPSPTPSHQLTFHDNHDTCCNPGNSKPLPPSNLFLLQSSRDIRKAHKHKYVTSLIGEAVFWSSLSFYLACPTPTTLASSPLTSTINAIMEGLQCHLTPPT